MSDEEQSTVKTQTIPQFNEKENAHILYNEARKAMIENPSQENIDAFSQANEHLFEVEDLYRIALRLLTERAIRLKYAILGKLSS